MRMDKLTSRFQQALADAQSLAVGRDHNLLEPVHVMVALLDQAGGSTRPLLAQAGVNVPLLRERLGEALEKLPKVAGQAGSLSVGNDLGRLLNLTDKLAQQKGDQFIASEWFVLAALEDTGAVGQALKAAGADKARLQAAIDKVRETTCSKHARGRPVGPGCWWPSRWPRPPGGLSRAEPLPVQSASPYRIARQAQRPVR